MNKVLHAFLTIGLVTILAIAPLVAGGNRPIVWALQAVLASLLVIGAGMGLAFGNRSQSDRSVRLLVWPAALFALVICWIGLQAQGFFLAHPVWQAVWPGGLEAGDVPARLTINRTETHIALLRLMTAAGVFLCAFAVGGERRQVHAVLGGFVVIACGYGLLALLFQVAGPLRPGFLMPAAEGQFSGSFVNRNHAATYFGLGLVVSCGLFIRTLRASEEAAGWQGNQNPGSTSWRHRVRALVGQISGQSGLALTGSAVLATALLLTGSRGGISASFAALAVLVSLHLLRGPTGREYAGHRRGGGGLVRFATAGILVVLIAVLFETAGARFVERLADQGVTSDGRLAVLETSTTALGDHLLMGSGYGTFADILPLYRGQALGGLATWDKAHNDYLELALGLGLPMALLLLAAIALPAWASLCGFFRRRRTPVGCSIAVAATSLVAIHALVDFSLQIQAVTLSFAALLGLGFAQSASQGTASQGTGHCRSRPSRRRRTAQTPVLSTQGMAGR